MVLSVVEQIRSAALWDFPKVINLSLFQASSFQQIVIFWPVLRPFIIESALKY